MDNEEMIARLLLEGHCCTEAIVKMGLHMRGEENEQMVSAARGLCRGMHAGCNCGALAGGALLLSMFDAGQAQSSWIPELVQWFAEEYGEKFGSIDCFDIAGDRMEYKAERCPALVTEVYKKCCTLLSKAELI